METATLMRSQDHDGSRGAGGFGRLLLQIPASENLPVFEHAGDNRPAPPVVRGQGALLSLRLGLGQGEKSPLALAAVETWAGRRGLAVWVGRILSETPRPQ